jgi:hypothetical protein
MIAPSPWPLEEAGLHFNRATALNTASAFT